MEVKTFLLADFANIDAANKMNVIGIFNRLSPATFPYTHPSMYLALRLQAELGEVATERRLRIQLVGEHGLEVANIETDFEVPRNAQGKRPAVHFTLGLQHMVFPEAGIYEFRLFIDRDQKAFLELEIDETGDQEL